MSIYTTPGATFEATATFDSGLTGTLGVRILDNAGATTTARTTDGIAEYPDGSGLYYVELTAPDTQGQFSIMFDDGTVSPGHVAVEDLIVGGTLVFAAAGDMYASVDELFRVLKVRTPTAEQTAAAERVLTAATGEINAEVDLDDDDELSGWELALAEEVCLERAVEHWQQGGAPFGLIGLGAETGVAFASTDSWARHAKKLGPLKRQWGFA